MFTVYSKENCPNCVTAKQFLTVHGQEFGEIQIAYETTKLVEGVMYLTRDDFMTKFPNVRQMPFITKNGEPIGGLQELRQMKF
jgi:glutaredoxin